MNLLLISSGSFFSTYGGGQVYIKNMVDELVYRGICPSIATPGGTEKIPPEYKGCPVFTIAETDSQDHLAKLLLEIKPDVVHAHGNKTAFVKACTALSISCIITAHHGGIVCPAGALLNAEDKICGVPASDHACFKCCIKSVPGWRLWFPLLSMIPLKVRLWIGTRLGTAPFIPFVTPLGIISCSIREKIHSVRDLGQRADRVIAPSPAIADALVRNGVPEQKVAVLPHGIPLPSHQPLSPDFGNRPLRFIYLGRINHVKGVHVMLRAFKELQPETYVLHIVGNAFTKAEKRYLKRLQRDFSSVNAVWHGGIPHAEIPDFIASCDVMVHPAICLEVYGLTIAESLAVGRPVIATRCGGPEVQIRDGGNGVLIPPNDPGALSGALIRFIENHSLVLKMSQHTGPVRNIEAHVNDLLKLYRRLISRDNSMGFS